MKEEHKGPIYSIPLKDDLLDPTLLFLSRLEEGKETEVAWNPEFIKTLWNIVGGKKISKPQDFYDQTKFAIKKEGIMERLSLIVPGIEKDKIQPLLTRILNILKLNKEFNSTEVTIQTITDKIAREQEPLYFKWADRFTTIHPRLEGVEKAFDKILRGKASAREMKRAGEIAASLTISDYPFEYDYYYEVLKPLFEQKEAAIQKDTRKKDFPPKIFGGRSFGHGKRKSSVARVYMKPGTGIIKINGKNYNEYFQCPHNLYSLIHPLHLMGSHKDFDFSIKVAGGGTTGQAEAIKLAMTKAIIGFIPEHGYWMRKNGMLTSDSRRVERKKPGLKKARKRTQWVKR